MDMDSTMYDLPQTLMDSFQVPTKPMDDHALFDSKSMDDLAHALLDSNSPKPTNAFIPKLSCKYVSKEPFYVNLQAKENCPVDSFWIE